MATSLTGYRPSWQRYLHYRLAWLKASGATLDIVWRYRQNYDAANGWQGQGENDLTRMTIRPASFPRVKALGEHTIVSGYR